MVKYIAKRIKFAFEFSFMLYLNMDDDGHLNAAGRIIMPGLTCLICCAMFPVLFPIAFLASFLFDLE